MRILVAPDKFKHSLGATAVAEEIATGLREILPGAEVEIFPVADGGEGTAEVIQRARGGSWKNCAARDALGRAIAARYLWIENSATAVLEISEAAGLWRLRADERDILRADTFGVGEMMRDAIEQGAREIIVGLGGSATNDGGFGMARALGFSFYDAKDRELKEVRELLRVQRLVRPERSWPKILAACDVRNLLLGEGGATQIFAAQKGATREEMALLEEALTRLARVADEERGRNFGELVSSGAAGGLGFGLAAFCGAELRSGFELVAEMLDLERAVRAADAVVTGEGKLDAQTLAGKAPMGVAQEARKFGKPVFAIVGRCTEARAGEIFERVFELMDGSMEEAEVRGRLRDCARTAARYLNLTTR